VGGTVILFESLQYRVGGCGSRMGEKREFLLALSLISLRILGSIGAMATPSTSNYTLDDDPPNGTRSIKLSNFSIQSTKLPILTIPQSDEYALFLSLTHLYSERELIENEGAIELQMSWI